MSSICYYLDVHAVDAAISIQAIEEAVNSGGSLGYTRRAGVVGTNMAWAASQNDRGVSKEHQHQPSCSTNAYTVFCPVFCYPTAELAYIQHLLLDSIEAPSRSLHELSAL